MKPFGCPVTGIIYTSLMEKLMKGNGPDWLFDVDSLTISMNYMPVVAGNQTNGIAGTRDNIVTSQAEKKTEPKQEFILIPFCITDPLISQDKDGEDDQATRSEFERPLQQEKQTVHPNSTSSINTVSKPVSADGPSFTNDDPSSPVNAAESSNAFEEHLFEIFSPFKSTFTLPPVSNVTLIDDTRIFSNAYDDEDVGADADLNNLETTINVSPIPTIRINKDHLKDQIIRDFNSVIQTSRMTKIFNEHAMKVWTLVNIPNGKRAIGTKWVFRNRKDKRGIVVSNKARLVTQGYTQEERIDYDEVFAPVARIKAISIMGEPLSPDRVFDFPMNEPHPAYDFFAPAPLPEYAGNPNNNNGWLAADDYLLGELEAMMDEQMIALVVDVVEGQMDAPMMDMEEDLAVLFGDDDFEDDASDGFGEEEVWEVNEDWLMAPTTPPPVLAVPPPSIYEVGGPSTAVAEGSSFPQVALGLPVPPSMIEDLRAGVTIGEIGPRVLAVEGQMQVMTSQMIQAVDRVEQVGLASRCVAERHADPAAVDYCYRDEQQGEHADAVHFGIGETDCSFREKTTKTPVVL
ncbi:putative ribonuclease H-like domain-containing protein, partial [Tanacetum coccineum]